jgi:hypothetical protein
MIPKAYCHLEVRGVADQGHGTMIPLILSRLMVVLHGHCAAHPGTCALDLPNLRFGNDRHSPHLGRIARLFFGAREQGDALLEKIEADALVSPYIMTGRIRALGDYTGPRVSLHRSRIAPRSQPNNRHRDLEAQRTQQAPFLLMRSHSTRQSFSLMLERRSYPGGGQAIIGGVPNSYGLSGAQPVYLPDLPT